eukprot:797382-Rhodomonas_salina.2
MSSSDKSFYTSFSSSQTTPARCSAWFSQVRKQRASRGSAHPRRQGRAVHLDVHLGRRDRLVAPTHTPHVSPGHRVGPTTTRRACDCAR